MATECTFDLVREAAEEETGIPTEAVTTREALARHVFRKRQALIGRAITAWKDSIEDDQILDLPAGVGWGFLWGQNWGLTIPRRGVSLLSPMEGIWLVDAHHIATDEWREVEVVSEPDAAALGGPGQPALLLRDIEVVLLDYPTAWLGQYDQVRLIGCEVGELQFDYKLDSLDVNDLIGPVLCRCLQLEAARFLALKADDLVQAGSLAAEGRLAQADFLGQLRAHTRTEKSSSWPRT